MLQIKLYQARQLVKAIEQGEVDLARAKGFLKQIAEAAPASGDYVILVDARQRVSKLSRVDLWYVAKELGEHGRTFQRPSALLVRPEDLESARTLELYARNRGFRVRAFASFEDSLDWLMTPSRPNPDGLPRAA